MAKNSRETIGQGSFDNVSKAFSIQNPQHATDGATIDSAIRVTSVKGKDQAYPNEKITYSVTGFSSTPTDTVCRQISWIVQVNNERENLTAKGDEITLKMKEEWTGKVVTVCGYLNSPAEGKGQTTKVKSEAVVLFVNGFEVSRKKRKQEYWEPLFVSNAVTYLKLKYEESTSLGIEDMDCIFIDGSDRWYTSGSHRFNKGLREGVRLIKTELKSKEVLNDENEQQKRIFIVTHSMGAALVEGMIHIWTGDPYYLAIDYVLHLSAADNRDFCVHLPKVTWQVNILPDRVLLYKNLDDAIKVIWERLLRRLGKTFTDEDPHY